MESELSDIRENLKKLMIDVAMIKEALVEKELEEIELSDWAKNELEEARNTPESECISHEEVEKMILRK